jgi:hypothetical protein
MELFLNVLWLLLAVPAVWIWRRETSPSPRSECLNSLRCALILGFTLMLLFPVVSATDDLHAMRPEMEESTPSKRAVKLTTTGKTPVRLSGPGPSAAPLASPATVCFKDQVCGRVVLQLVLFTDRVQRGSGSGRAPPFARLG